MLAWREPALRDAAPERAQASGSAQAQQLANAELPWLPLVASPSTMYLGERVTGLSPSISYLYYPWAATLGAR